MKHRGPDSSGTFQHENLFLGHQRLSIQDLTEGANQPMYCADGRHILVFNGEIYNHWELRKSELPNYDFKTKSDTETLLALYINYKENVLKLLNGIFAFVVFDRQENTLFVARDHFGVKPLYYSLSDTNFSCASELKAFLPFQINKELDIKAIQAYLTFMWCPGEDTPFDSIKKLLPGSYIHVDLKDLSKTKIVRYYTLKFPVHAVNDRPFQNWVDTLDFILCKAVERQLLSDVPVGFFLSGGLDSSLLVAVAKKLYPDKKFKCYTIDSGESKDGFEKDLFYAKKVAAFLNVDLTEIKVDSSIFSKFDDIIWYLDEPVSDPAPFNVYEISKQAREDGIKVLISGTGGDDIFSGYRRHQALIIDQYIDYIPIWLRSLIKNVIQDITSDKSFVRRLKKFTKSITRSKNDRLIGFFEWQDFDFIRKLIIDNLQGKLSSQNAYFEKLLHDVENVEDDLNKLLYLEVYTFLVDHNLNYTDKAGMANSVEIRVPFLDKDLVEFSVTIPTCYKMRGSQTKYILRKVAERYLPKEIIYRSKTGFGVPLEYWTRYEMDDYIISSLNSVEVTKSSIFNPAFVTHIINENKALRINASYNIWSLLAVQSWLKQFKSL